MAEAASPTTTWTTASAVEDKGIVGDVYEPPFSPELIESTQRFKRLNKLDAYYAGEQYKGRPDFWTGTRNSGDKPAPLRERAPCVVYPLPKACVNQATRFTFGEGRFPHVKVQVIAANDAALAALAVSDEDAATLQAAVNGLIDQAQLRSMMRALLRKGLSACTGVAVVTVRNGKFQIDTPHPKNCIPTFVDTATNEVGAMTIVYRFDKEVEEELGSVKKITTKQFWYRRDITATEYVVFKDALIEEGKDVVWTRDDDATLDHDLGFCPVVWIPNLREADGDPDGCGLYEGLDDEFDALNFALSQRHRGINYWGVPQPWEALAPEDKPPAATAQAARVPKGKESNGSGYSRGKTEPARATSPDQIWSYQVSEDRKSPPVGLLETTGKAFDAATKHVLDVRSRILEAIDVVLMDPATVAGKGDISAKALSYMYAPLLGLVDELRECWWTHGLQRILSMMLRIAKTLGADGLYVPGAAKLITILGRFEIDGMWFPPAMTPIWGDYFSPSNAEILAAVQTAAAAKGVLVTQDTATRYVAPYFGVEDLDAELADLEGEQAEAVQQQQDAMTAKVDAKPGESEPGAKDDSEPNGAEETKD